jgi:hypothetical protein
MSFNISNHALEQMRLRGIQENIVWDILNRPGQVITAEDKTIYQSVVIEAGKQYLVRVIVNNKKVPNMVITVYKTSKIKKYYEGDL